MSTILVNELTQRGLLARSIHEDLQPQFLEMWYEDLETVEDGDELIHAANSILLYYGSIFKVVGLGWSDTDACYLWKLSKKATA